jgi:hypothetical protein
MQSNINKLVEYMNKLNDKEHRDIYKCLSCIFGAFLGDAIGAYCEFHKPNHKNIKKIFVGNPMFGEAPGQVTDDSEMAISSTFAIMDNPELNNLRSDYLYYFYGLWHLSRPKDEGITTRKALMNFKTENFNPEKVCYSENFEKIAQNNDKSLANGFLMRTSPFIVWCYYRFNEQINAAFNKKDNSQELFSLFQTIQQQARKDNICTHPNYSLSIAHSIFCIMALGAICELKSSDILNNTKTLLKNEFFNNKNHKSITEMIINEINIYSSNPGLKDYNNCFLYFTNGEKNVTSHMGFYFHAFRLTLYYLYFFDEIKSNKYTKYREIMNQICSFGGDTDTNAAIVGTVIGPLIGFKNFGDKEFLAMVKLVPRKRLVYSPGLMILYVHYVKMNKNNEEKRKNFLIMILNMMLNKIDINNLNSVFSLDSDNIGINESENNINNNIDEKKKLDKNDKKSGKK